MPGSADLHGPTPKLGADFQLRRELLGPISGAGHRTLISFSFFVGRGDFRCEHLSDEGSW